MSEAPPRVVEGITQIELARLFIDDVVLYSQLVLGLSLVLGV